MVIQRLQSLSLSRLKKRPISLICRNEHTSRKSPYLILNLQQRSNPTKDEIKSKFRELAKKVHPDLNRDDESNAEKMVELVAAYDTLMNNERDDFEYARMGSNKLATLCEVCTLQELRVKSSVSVFPIEVTFEDQNQNSTYTDEKINYESEIQHSIYDCALQIGNLYQVKCHSEDSVNDLKRNILNEYGPIILSGRSHSWEIFSHNENMNVVLSYHMFLYNYRISNGDIIYAVIENID